MASPVKNLTDPVGITRMWDSKSVTSMAGAGLHYGGTLGARQAALMVAPRVFNLQQLCKMAPQGDNLVK